MLRVGFGLVAVGVAALVAIDSPGTSLWLSVPIWMVAGTAMGVALTLVSVLVLELSPESEQGANSAALQISDMTGTIIGSGAAGASITAFGVHRLDTAMAVADLGLAAVGLLGLAAVSRAALIRR
jgi:hypothetical protein